jgi:DNA-binding response OmpR family regulator
MGKNKTMKVLIVEDDHFLLSMYATKFEKEDFQVLSAEDGEKGLRLATQEGPDIILLDIILPKMDGFEVLKKLKSQKETKDTPVLLLTNLSQQDDSKKGLSLGADDYLVKAHFMPSEVVEKVKKYLGDS